MIRNHLIALAARRARLSASAQTEREVLARALAPTDAAATAVLTMVAAARRAAGEARRHPEMILAGIALLLVLRPRRTFAWLARGWSVWRLVRGAQRWWIRFDALRAPAAPPR